MPAERLGVTRKEAAMAAIRSPVPHVTSRPSRLSEFGGIPATYPEARYGTDRIS